MNKENYILNIHKKLANSIQLDGDKIRTVIAALRESTHRYQTPYYSVTYHDKYGNEETRIMNPDFYSCRPAPENPDLYLTDERFYVDFRRFTHKEDL